MAKYLLLALLGIMQLESAFDNRFVIVDNDLFYFGDIDL